MKKVKNGPNSLNHPFRAKQISERSKKVGSLDPRFGLGGVETPVFLKKNRPL